MEKLLYPLFRDVFGCEPEETVAMTGSGSHRQYFRLSAGGRSAVGVVGTDADENRAFLSLDNHFASKGIQVPKILAVSGDGMCYLQEDLGTELLYDRVAHGRESGAYDEAERALLCRAMASLPKIQFEGGAGLDWSLCYPEPAFGERMVNFDLNYFKYCFLKATGLGFNEARLQDDFDRLRADLLEDVGDTFLYRDFQARNVMVRDDTLYFIDFQGGRRGPIYYDVASFAWQARARYPDTLRQEMIAAYLEALKAYVPEVDEAVFHEKLRLFVLFRTLQVLGTYGFRGYFEKKPHFLASVPFAMDNLRALVRTPFTAYPYLNAILTKLTTMSQFYETADDRRLEVSIYSFAYKKGIPVDRSGNGGGYVFDCRAINNPGKFEYYRQFNGMDAEVIKFLEDDGGIVGFLDHVYALVDPHVRRFIERKFTHLQVAFGCTGGQHRSVYCAEHLAEHLRRHFDVRITVCHRELDVEKIV